MWWSRTVSLCACSTATVLAQPHPRLRNHDQRLALWRPVYIYRQLIFLGKSDCLGCAVLLCLVVCLSLLASFFLPSHLIKHVHVHASCDHFDMLMHTAEGVHAGCDAGVASSHVVCLHPQPHLPVLPGTLCHRRLLLLHAPCWVWGRVPGGRFTAEGSHVVCQHGNPELRKSIQELSVFLSTCMYNVHVYMYVYVMHLHVCLKYC